MKSKIYYIQIDDEPNDKWWQIALPEDKNNWTQREWVMLDSTMQLKLLSGEYRPHYGRTINLIDPVVYKSFSMPLMERM